MKPLRLLLAAAIAATLAGLVPSPAHADDPDLVTTPVSFTNNTGETLHGLVYTPRTATGRLPGMVLPHGSGSGPHRTLATEAKPFAAQGIAFLAYDKRTVGYSDTHRDYAALAEDVQVPPAESAEVFEATVKGNLSIRIVQGADHLLKVKHPDGREDTAYPGYPELVGA